MKGRTVLKKRTWIERNPRTFVIGVTGASLLILLSRPIYDIFFNPVRPDISELKKEKRRFGASFK